MDVKLVNREDEKQLIIVIILPASYVNEAAASPAHVGRKQVTSPSQDTHH